MLWTWIKRLLWRFREPDAQGRRIAWPTRDDIERLPPFEAIGLDDIIEVANPASARLAVETLMGEAVLGFDTESKPVFVKGHVSTGPHVAQLSTLSKAYVFMLHDHETRRAVASLIASPDIKKVGFGLSEDVRRVPIKLKVQPRSVVDLETLFSARGYGRGVGVKVAVAIALKRRFMKSKKASTSNWMVRRLNERQLLYAANDAYAAIKVYEALNG